MKIEELIKKTGDKLISQKDKLEYYMAIKKLELIAKIPNKKQRSEAMGRFKDILAKKVTPVVMAALTAISPVVLAGCDETKTPSDTQVAYVTDANGEFVTDGNGNLIEKPQTNRPEVKTEPETERERTEDELRPIIDEVETELERFFSTWSWDDVLNGVYIKELENLIPEQRDYDTISNHWMLRPGSGATDAYYIVKGYFYTIESLIGEDSKYCVNIDIPRNTTGVDVKYYRDVQGNTAGFILTTPTGEIEYTGIFNGEVYTVDEKYSKDLPFAITGEISNLINQAGQKEGLAKLFGDSIVAFTLTGEDIITAIRDEADPIIRKISITQNGGKAWFIDEDMQVRHHENYYKIATRQGSKEKQENGNIISNEYKTNMESIMKDIVLYTDGKQSSEFTYEMKDAKLQVSDSEGNNYIIANLTYDYNPENIKLPTQEAEAER